MAYESDDPMPEQGRPIVSEEPSVPPRAGSQGQSVSCQDRRGDDDPCPQPLPQDAGERVEAKRRAEQERIVKQRTASPAVDESEDSLPDMPSDGRVLKFVSYSFVALVGLWLCHLIYGPVRNVLVAQSPAEMILASLLLAATVGVFAYVAIYAWSLFSSRPRVTAIKESEYDGDKISLWRSLEAGYVSGLYARRKEYQKELRLKDDAGLLECLNRLGRREFGDASVYVETFKKLQSHQDDLAAKVIKKYAMRIAVKTAASPWRCVDMLAVFYNSTIMICEIARIYDRRVSRIQAFKLLMRWAFNLYVAGELGTVMEASADGLNNSLDGLIGEGGFSALVQPMLPMFSKIVGKAAEGGINAYNAYRFGRNAVVAFRCLQ